MRVAGAGVRTARRMTRPLMQMLGIWVLLAAGGESRGASPKPDPASPRTVISRIDSLRDAGDLQGAVTLASDNLARARTHPDVSYYLELTRRYGGLLAYLGQTQQAETTLREVISLAEAQQDSLSLCDGLRWLSVTLSHQGRNHEAEEVLQRLLDAARRCGDEAHQGWAWVGMGWVDIQRGLPREALEDYSRALLIFDRLSIADGIAFARNGLGIGYADLGNYDRALRAWRMSLSITETIERPAVREFLIGLALNNLASLEYNFGDPGEAARHFERLRRRALDGSNVREAVVPAMNAALCLTRLGRYADAVAELESLMALCLDRNYRDVLGKIRYRLGEVHRATGNMERAAAIMRRVLAMGEELPAADRVEAAIALSEIQFGADSSAAALETLAEAERLLERSPNADQQRHLDAGRGHLLLALGRPAEALAVLLRLADEERRLGLTTKSLAALSAAARACRQLGRPDSALALLERAARTWENDRGIPLDPEWRERRGAESREVYTDLARTLYETTEVDGDEERARMVFDRLQVFKARTLMERLHGPRGRPGLAAAASESDTSHALPINFATAATMQEVLKTGELLLDVYLGPRASALIALSSTHSRVIWWPPEKRIDEMLRHYHALLATPPSSGETLDRGVLDTVSSNIRRDLLADLEDLFADSRRVFIAPDGVVNLLPLAPLFRSERLNGANFLDIVRVPSATYLMQNRLRGAMPDAGEDIRILALGGVRTRSGDRLPGVVKEMEFLARRFERVATATGQPEITRLSDCDLLHIAAHAEINDSNPWRSRIILDPDRPQSWLYADQISRRTLHARLAVLSSCESARGAVLSGEGVLGLCQAFLSAGVPAVLATLWPVDDQAAFRFTQHFYDALAGDRTAADALQIAQRRLRGESAFAHPYYWAGYVLVGVSDTPLRLSLQDRDGFPYVLGIALLAGLVMLMALALVRSRRRPFPAPRGSGRTRRRRPSGA
ncbi:MAG: CHAT domain-containing protein [Candidatus Eisenbacteria bacterium]|nr:CHAT domain-containing protein [Candidatus Eisenbacteria bacterium]